MRERYDCLTTQREDDDAARDHRLQWCGTCDEAQVGNGYGGKMSRASQDRGQQAMENIMPCTARAYYLKLHVIYIHVSIQRRDDAR